MATSIKRRVLPVLLCSVALAGVMWFGETPADESARAGAAQTVSAENAQPPGVVSLASGLQYKILRPGSGRKPQATDRVTVHYRGRLPDGTEIDSSYQGDGPANLRVQDVVAGWREALLLMQEGAKWEVFIPPELVKLKRGVRRRALGGDQPVIYEIELLSVGESDAPEVAMTALGGEPADGGGHEADDLDKDWVTWVYWMRGSGSGAGGTRSQARRLVFFEQNARTDSVITLPSGLQYRVLRRGNGRTPAAGDRVTVHYRGTRLDGTEFDSSHRGRGPATFRLDEVIPGWQEALQHMEEGATWELYIPPELAYRQPGPLGAEPVIFEVELLAVSRADRDEVGMAAVQPLEAAGTSTEFRDDGQAAAFDAKGEPVAAGRTSPAGDTLGAGAIALPGGIRYRVISNGAGVSPMADEQVTVQYRVALSGGHETGAYAGAGRTTFRIDQTIPAWQAVFRRMQEGARWELSLPSELASSKWGPPEGATVIFEVELLTVTPPQAAGDDAASLPGFEQTVSTDERTLVSLPGGLQYRVLQQGRGDTPVPDDTITVRYRATLVDGDAPDSAYSAEGRESFRLDWAIPGWQEAFEQMQAGATWELYMPSEFAYSTWGPLGGRTIRIEVELLSLGGSEAEDLPMASMPGDISIAAEPHAEQRQVAPIVEPSPSEVP